MPSGSDVADTIEPGSVPYVERGPLEDRIQQVVRQAQAPTQAAPAGEASRGGLDKLAQGPVSGLPITDGLSVGPGAGPAEAVDPIGSPRVDQLRVLAAEARSPRIRQLARDALRAEARKR